MSIRGGGIIDKSLFVQISAISYLLFGIQLFGVPKMFWNMNFKSPEFTKSTEFLSRMFGLALIMLAALSREAQQSMLIRYSQLLPLLQPTSAHTLLRRTTRPHQHTSYL